MSFIPFQSISRRTSSKHYFSKKKCICQYSVYKNAVCRPDIHKERPKQNVHHWPLPLLNLRSVSISAEAPVTEHFIRPLLSKYYLLNTICIFIQMSVILYRYIEIFFEWAYFLTKTCGHSKHWMHIKKWVAFECCADFLNASLSKSEFWLESTDYH